MRIHFALFMFFYVNLWLMTQNMFCLCECFIQAAEECIPCFNWTEYPIHDGASQVALMVKKLPAKAGDVKDVGSVPGLERFPGEGHDNPL